MPCNDDQFIVVLPEDPKVTANHSSSNKNNQNTNIYDSNDLDDLMFDMTAPTTIKAAHHKVKVTQRSESNHYVNEQG